MYLPIYSLDNSSLSVRSLQINGVTPSACICLTHDGSAQNSGASLSTYDHPWFALEQVFLAAYEGLSR